MHLPVINYNKPSPTIPKLKKKKKRFQVSESLPSILMFKLIQQNLNKWSYPW